MKVESKLCMATGNGENSYATNSRIQAKAILENRPVLHKAIEEICSSLSPATTTMVVADLGCSSGPNTLLVVSEVVGAVRAYNRRKNTVSVADERRVVAEVRFFLNDLPSNDFNLLFRSLAEEEAPAAEPPYYYVAGVPGSYYTRLFPWQSVHLFHSSYSLMWRSKVPEKLSNGDCQNEENIYIGETSAPIVTQLFVEQFHEDLELFLTLRSKELVSGGQMLLTFLGRKSQEKLTHGDVGTMYDLLAKSLGYLVQKGHVAKERLSSFNLPYYAPSVDEVKAVIKRTALFDIHHMRCFESSWDPMDDTKGDVALNCASSGANVAKGVRAVMEPLIVAHFGDNIIDELFMVFSSLVANHLEKGKAMYPVIVVSLKKKALR